MKEFIENVCKEITYWAWIACLWGVIIWLGVQGYKLVTGLVS